MELSSFFLKDLDLELSLPSDIRSRGAGMRLDTGVDFDTGEFGFESGK
jgi:hypothetical protein